MIINANLVFNYYKGTIKHNLLVYSTDIKSEIQKKKDFCTLDVGNSIIPVDSIFYN